MGGTQGKPQPVRETGGTGPEVFLNVYIPSSGAKEVMGMGVYHTGIEVAGVEYAYGGGSVSASGVFRQKPKDVPPGSQWQFGMTQPLGRSKFDLTKTKKVIQDLGTSERFRADAYDLMRNNCNHFTSTAAMLLGLEINYPEWVNKAAKMGAMFTPETQKGPIEEQPSHFSGKGHTMQSPTVGSGPYGGNAPGGQRPNPWKDPNFRPQHQ